MINLNKTSTFETPFTLQVKAMEGLLSVQMQSAIDRTLFDFVAMPASATTLLIYERNQTNTSGLSGS